MTEHIAVCANGLKNRPFIAVDDGWQCNTNAVYIRSEKTTMLHHMESKGIDAVFLVSFHRFPLVSSPVLC